MSYQALPPVGQATMAASLPVVLASNQSAVPVSGTVSVSGTIPVSGTFWQATQPVSIAGTVAVSAASLPLPTGAATETTLAAVNTKLGAALNVSPDNVLDNLTTSASVSSAATVVSVGTAGFNGGSFQVTSAGTGCTVTYEQSNDNSTWLPLNVVPSSLVSTNPTTTSTTTGIYSFSNAAAYVRARVSTYGSGTVTIALTQKRFAPPVANVSISAGSQTIGNLARQNGFTDSTATLTASSTFTGTGRAAATNYTKFNATAFADQAGTLYIDQSLDTGGTYQQVATVAVVASVGITLSVPVTGAAGSATLYRVRYVNGGVNQGTFRLSSSYTAA